MKKGIWIIWLVLCVAIAGYFSRALFFSDDKSEFLIGETTYGHYQIELACSSCHTDPFGGQEVLQDACVNCHQAELDAAQDSHPRKKFTDPRNAQRLEGLDARYCVSCHTEHQKEQTQPMGLTLPEDYCFHCHQEIGDERESHKDLGYETCASAGCHNYHDNRALYENFLVANANKPWLAAVASLPSRTHAALTAHGYVESVAINPAVEAEASKHPDVLQGYVHTSHAEADVACSQCHTGADQTWLDSPGVGQCQACHQQEAEGFLGSKHGMRLATGELGAMTPEQSALPFHQDHLQQAQNCSACHVAHEFNTESASVEACLSCHADEHSLAFLSSPHGQLWQDPAVPYDEKVSCASCHLPRVASGKTDANGQPIMRVEHNQNHTLRPNEKMIRTSCMSCHSLEFSIDALADPALIKNNFNGKPAQHIPSIDWALKRASE